MVTVPSSLNHFHMKRFKQVPCKCCLKTHCEPATFVRLYENKPGSAKTSNDLQIAHCKFIACHHMALPWQLFPPVVPNLESWLHKVHNFETFMTLRSFHFRPFLRLTVQRGFKNKYIGCSQRFSAAMQRNSAAKSLWNLLCCCDLSIRTARPKSTFI